MKRFLPWIIAIGALLLIAFVVRHLRTNGAASYQTADVTRGAITQAVTATGTLNPVLNVQVGSQVSGTFQNLFADFNSQVKAGQVVAQIDPALFRAAVTESRGRCRQRPGCTRAGEAERQAHSGSLCQKNVVAGRPRSGAGESASSRGQCENQTRRVGQSEGRSRSLHDHFPYRRRGDLAQRRCRPDRRRQPAGAGDFSNRK